MVLNAAVKGSWSSVEQPASVTINEPTSPFRAIVWEYCYKATIEELKKHVIETYFKDLWNNNQEVSEGLQKLIEVAAPKAVMNFFTSMKQAAMYQLRNDIQNHRI